MPLLNEIHQAYPDTGSLNNNQLYAHLVRSGHIKEEDLHATQPVGKANDKHSILKRKIRWHQQTLKAMGIIEQTGIRGEWRLSQKKSSNTLPLVADGKILLAYATDLGVALWGDCRTVFSDALPSATISLVLTSPPYPLKQPRAYGNRPVHEYVDWLCYAIEPMLDKLHQGGSICLNLSNDIFASGSPARSTYLERLVIAFEDRLGLYKMDMIPWINPCKPPGPVQWASKTRQQLNVGWEPIYWFTNNPEKCQSNNNRILEPHSEAQLALIKNGGMKAPRINSDGAYRIKEGSYSNLTAGKIPKNVFNIPHNCADQRRYKQAARYFGLKPHGAAFPLKLAEKLILFLTKEGDLVVDPFAGSNTTGRAAENLGRRWMASEVVYDYVVGSAMRFSGQANMIFNKQMT